MNRILSILALLLIITSFTRVNAQVSSSATSSANLLGPISIAKVTDMSFGNLAVSPALNGTIILSSNSTRTATGGVTLPAITGVVTAARFVVSGEAGTTYSINLPAAISLASGSNFMNVDTFTSTPSASGSLTTGTEDLYVGATLHVNAMQAAGIYTNTTDLVVSVNYN